MIFPVQWGWPQIVLALVALLAMMLIISCVMSLVIKSQHIELLEDRYGRTYRLRRRRWRFRWRHGIGGALLLIAAIVALEISVALQSYLSFSGEIKVATIHAAMIANMPHTMTVDLILYDQNGQQLSDHQYKLQGDDWTLGSELVIFQPWLNYFGIHSGYKISRLTSQYEDFGAHVIKPIPLNGGDGDFYQAIRNKTWWSVPTVRTVEVLSVTEPADDVTYDVFINQAGMLAVPEKG